MTTRDLINEINDFVSIRRTTMKTERHRKTLKKLRGGYNAGYNIGKRLMPISCAAEWTK
jgi:hypothetical protein